MTKRCSILLLLGLLLAFSCQRPRTIPREEMEDIFYEMLVLDQQVKRNQELLRQSDTTQVYAAVFKAHGYRPADFRHSLSVYLEDPSHMEKMMGAVADRLEKDAKLAKAEVSLDQWRKQLLRVWYMPADTTWPKQTERLVDTLPVRLRRDTVLLSRPLDSLRLIPRDSLLFLRDSLAVRDTLAVKDTVQVKKDTVPVSRHTKLPVRKTIGQRELE